MSKKVSAVFLLLACLSYGQSLFTAPAIAKAAQLRDVVISEIAWAGSGDSSSDEWIELYNNTNQLINLTGWVIDDHNGAQTYPLQGTITAHSYFLLESREIATSIVGDMIKSTSLSNNGDSLVLRDASQNVVDTVNSTNAAWFAGSNTTHATMERINLQSDGDQASNWHSGASIATATSSSGGTIVGSPKAANTGSTTTPETTTVSSATSPNIIRNDQDISVSYQVQNASNVSNFGFDISYDPTMLSFTSATEGDFLKSSGSTSFQSGLLNNQAGNIVIGSARTENPLTGKSGNGTLFTLNFHTSSSAYGPSPVEVKSTSFLSSPSEHIAGTQWPNTVLAIQNSTVNTITNLRASPGTERYSIELNWDSASNGPFQIYRQSPHDQWQLLGTTSTTNFLDHDSVVLGGNIVPQMEYQYRVSSGDLTTAQTTSGSDERGLKADNNHTDKVDGNDLEQIARLWTTESTDSSFKAIVDTNIDGLIGGDDLLDLAVDWAKTYQ